MVTELDVSKPVDVAPHPPRPGPLGLDGMHREIADLIRRSEVLACRGCATTLHDTTDLLVRTLVRHLEDEQSELGLLTPAQREQVLAGQRALLDSAIAFAAHPVADAGADLLAMLVRQADTEQAAFPSGSPTATGRVSDLRFEFSTDWMVDPPPVLSHLP